MTIKEFSAAYAKLCMAFNQEAAEGQMAVYYDFLKDYPMEKIIDAVNIIVGTKKFFPKVSEIIEILRSNIAAEAEEAWNQALRSAEVAGRLPISNAVARALNAVGGMIKLRDCPTDDLHWLRKEFIDAYSNLQYSDIRVKECYGLTGAIVDNRKEIELAPEIRQMLGNIGKEIK